MISYDYPTYKTPKKKRSRTTLAFIAAPVVVMLVAIFAVLFVSSSSKDSGVEACKKLGHSTSTDSGGPMSKDDYAKARAPFEHSKHADVKTAGTAVVDTVYKMDQESDQTNDEDLAGSLSDLSTLKVQWAALQSACKNHGVSTVPDLG